jgi:transposase
MVVKKKLIDITNQEIEVLYDKGKEATVKFIRSLIDKINEIEAIVQQQQQEIDKLKAIINKDSHNSSKPPSSDSFNNKKKTKSQRKKSGKKPGGQKGHKGKTLKQSDNPDNIIIKKVTNCSHCQKDLAGKDPINIEKRQVVDIDIKVVYTEYQAESKVCDCGCITKAEFPEHITAAIQYGENTKAVLNYLSFYQLIPYNRLSELFGDIFNLPLSVGTIANINNNLGAKLENWEEDLRKQLLNQPVLHFDETGLRVLGVRSWLHCISSSELTYYSFHEKRGTKAIDDINILPYYDGFAVHDFWKSYLKYNNCFHILCNAHHLRNLTFINEQFDQEWAKNMIDLLLDIKKHKESFIYSDKFSFTDIQIRKYEAEYDNLIEIGIEANPPPVQPKNKRGRKKKGEALNLAERFRDYKASILAFMYNFSLPFDNNQGERDIRMTKVKQKISGCFRSLNGVKYFCRVRSYISTIKKKGLNVMEQIVNALAGKAYNFTI